MLDRELENKLDDYKSIIILIVEDCSLEVRMLDQYCKRLPKMCSGSIKQCKKTVLKPRAHKFIEHTGQGANYTNPNLIQLILN